MFSKKSDMLEENDYKPSKLDRLWNGLTLITLLATLAVVIVGLVIFNNPRAAVNPFPPPELPERLVLPTSTVTATQPPTLVPTSTPTAENTPTATATQLPTIVASPTVEVVLIPGTPSVIQTTEPTPEEGNSHRYAFELQAPPQALSADLYNPTRECSWMGVAGRIFDIDGHPVKGIRVAVTGYLGFEKIDLLSLSGTALQYGPSGYEFTLSDTSIASTGRLSIQLFDQSDWPLSPEISFDTYADCDLNLVLIDFKQVDD